MPGGNTRGISPLVATKPTIEPQDSQPTASTSTKSESKKGNFSNKVRHYILLITRRSVHGGFINLEFILHL